MKDLNKLTIVEARKALDNKEISSLDLTKACLKQIEKLNADLNACLNVSSDSALLQAKEADKRIKEGEKGALLGIPYLAKDNLLTKGIKTTAASKILENYVAPYNATVISKLEKAGAVLLGKTNLDEFAHGGSTENSAYGVVKNPWDKERVPGGSSGGSAAAVTADMCIFALGTDTGSSIRQPASFCNVVGLKPSYGRVSRYGLISMTSSTDVVGPISKTVVDTAIVLSAIAGNDKKDSSTSDKEKDNYIDDINKPLKGKKIAWVKEYFPKTLSQEARDSVLLAKKHLEDLGAKFVEISLPATEYAISVYYIITPAEISSNLARFDGIRFGFNYREAKNIKQYYLESRGRSFGAEAKRRIMLGTYVLSSGYYDDYYVKAQKFRTMISREFEDAFKKVDAILSPVSPTSAFKIGEKTNPLDMYLEDQFLSAPSLAGICSISIPSKFVSKLPFGVQLMSARFEEKKLLNISNILFNSLNQGSKKLDLSN
ncbi:Asp-tRNA(Asn)/Glu-tRNA(Gln) amidotransferase subunit GatA [Patescibacteria group bacterium]|nr:Asp-tRNA(Asn)/Glu-tRNA(Gln) amidotransferase subunit GatA [Patescibacteria group bacterium]